MSELAYLVIREGSKWTDVFRLISGQSVTIGRAPTNQIVIKDERCSRNHAELFMSEGHWVLRDLGEPQRHRGRGTTARRRLGPAAGRHDPHRPLAVGLRPQPQPGLQRFQQPPAPCGCGPGSTGKEAEATVGPADEVAAETSSVLAPYEPTTITHRKGQTRFLESTEEGEGGHLQDRPGGRQALPSGFRAGQGRRRRRHGGNGPDRTVRDAPHRRRRPVAVAPRLPGIADRQRAGSRRQPHDHRGAHTTA